MKPQMSKLHWAPSVSSQPHWQWHLWWRWVIANALGELFGLGLAAAGGVMVIVRFGELRGVAGTLFTAVLMVVLGVGEGVIVGYAQWRVLRTYLETMTARDWIGATALGALIAWMLGMLPSTIIKLSASDLTAPHALGHAQMVGLATLMGAGLGLVLAWPQWRVLRRYLSHAVWWLPANAFAWAVAMPITFIGADTASLLFIILMLLLTGAIVGALHGIALVWLLAPRERTSRPPLRV
jgi:hypothetical protein